MAAGLEGQGFWLPSEFLRDDDFLTDEDDFNNSELHSGFSFPSEFPYHFETHPHHLLQKFSTISTSPQSTLANFGSANGRTNGPHSPLTMPMTSQYDAVGDLIEVAKLKLETGYLMNSSYPPPRNLPQFSNAAKIPTPSVYLNTKFDARAVGRVDQVAWPPRRTRTPARAAAEKVYAGTGVFLPRRYENQDFSHRNASPLGPPRCYAPPFHGRTSAQIHTNPYCGSSFQPQLRAFMGRPVNSDLNSMLARRGPNFITWPPDGSSTISCLPREWTY